MHVNNVLDDDRKDPHAKILTQKNLHSNIPTDIYAHNEKNVNNPHHVKSSHEKFPRQQTQIKNSIFRR